MKLLTKRNFSEFAAPSGSEFDLIQIVEEQKFHIVIPLPFLSHCIVDIWARFLVDEGFDVNYSRCPFPKNLSKSPSGNQPISLLSQKMETSGTWSIHLSWLEIPNGYRPNKNWFLYLLLSLIEMSVITSLWNSNKRAFGESCGLDRKPL